jgi:sugar O-acyltransferase (sialic acid O-acetyltransferase NeuD family)
MKKIAIIGAGGFGREVAQLVKDINKREITWDVIGYFDDVVTEGEFKNGFQVMGPIEKLKEKRFNNIYLVCALGNPKSKQTIVQKIKKLNQYVQFTTLIHPTAVIGDENFIGEGSIICAGSILTTNIIIGKHVIVNISTTIGHDSKLNDFCTILPGAHISGNVLLHEGVDVGTGTAMIPGIEVGKYTVIGAGAVVNKSLPEYCTAVGVPAKPIKFHKNDN